LTWKLRLFVIVAGLSLPASIVAAQHPLGATPQTFEQLLRAAEAARDENRNDEAIRLFQRALSEQPESEQALWYLATIFYEKGQYAQARDALRQFMTVRPDAGPGWALLGICEFELREYPRALDHLRRGMSQGIGDRKELAQPLLYDLAALFNRFERYDESMALLAFGSLDTSLTEPAGLAGLGMPLLPGELPADMRAPVEIAGKGVLAMQAEHSEEAGSAFKQLVAEYPKQPGVHFLYGAYLVKQAPDEAIHEFERELEISPFHVVARVRLAEQMIDRGEFDRALDLARQAIKLAPKRASAHAFAGEALIGKGKVADGINELETARAADSSVSRVHWDLMRAYAAAGRKQEAEREKREMEKLLHGDASIQ
jgi:tetratricopeptide (TPR) repeat protein